MPLEYEVLQPAWVANLPMPTVASATSTMTITFLNTTILNAATNTTSTNVLDGCYVRLEPVDAYGRLRRFYTRNREVERERIARQAVAKAAHDRAEALLLSLVSPANQERYRSRGEILVTGSAGGRYLLQSAYTGGVVQVSEGIRLCAHPPLETDEGGRLPIPDVLIAQMLYLATDEQGFLNVANRM